MQKIPWQDNNLSSDSICLPIDTQLNPISTQDHVDALLRAINGDLMDEQLLLKIKQEAYCLTDEKLETLNDKK